MVEVSKLMLENSNIGYLKCSELIHPWTDSCFEAFQSMAFSNIKGALLFFAPIHLPFLVFGLSTLSVTEYLDYFVSKCGE